MAMPVPEPRRREAFAALVAAQDRGLTVVASRKQIAQEFSLDEATVIEIEKEGESEEWPPLGD